MFLFKLIIGNRASFYLIHILRINKYISAFDINPYFIRVNKSFNWTRMSQYPIFCLTIYRSPFIQTLIYLCMIWFEFHSRDLIKRANYHWKIRWVKSWHLEVCVLITKYYIEECKGNWWVNFLDYLCSCRII